jgi:hypothetical protein
MEFVWQDCNTHPIVLIKCITPSCDKFAKLVFSQRWRDRVLKSLFNENKKVSNSLKSETRFSNLIEHTQGKITPLQVDDIEDPLTTAKLQMMPLAYICVVIGTSKSTYLPTFFSDIPHYSQFLRNHHSVLPHLFSSKTQPRNVLETTRTKAQNLSTITTSG